MKPDPRLATLRGDVASALWPPVFSNNLASLAALVATLDATQWLAPEALAAGQARQLERLAAHFDACSPAFRDRLAAAGLAADALDIETLPRLAPLTRRQVQAADAALHCPVPPGHEPLIASKTSGSTGEPVRIVKDKVTQLFWLALGVRYALWHEPDLGARLAALRVVDRAVTQTARWDGGVGALFETGPMLIVDNGFDLADQMARLGHFAAESLIVYPSNLAGLIERAEALPSLRRIRTIGETVTPELRAAAAARFGATLKDCYSAGEFGYVAIECPESGLYHLMAESLIVEVVDEAGRPCGDGETGQVLVTDLHNHAMPMIRYATGDLAEPGPPCPCGRGLPTLRRVLGRERNLVLRPDGTSAWPLTGYREFRDIAPVVQFQFLQLNIEEVEVRLVVETPLSEAQEAALVALIQKSLGWPFTIRLAYFEGALPRAANGKFEEFVRLF
jgi:phenylacetate-CoA ligase